MLDPSQCFAAPISAAGQITLVLPRSRYEHRCLIVMSGGKPFAVCLDELDQLGYFRAFECEENDAWKGLHIPGVQIELDETSLHDAETFHAPLGSMVRSEDQLAIRVNLEGPRHVRSAPLVILDGLPPCAPHLTACFLKWQIVLGRGDDRQVLWTADLTPNGR